MSLGSIIRNRREQLGLTLDQVAVSTGFSKPYLSTIETGKVKNPPGDKLLSRLEEILDFESGLLQFAAHMQRLPADVRSKYETMDAQNRKYKQLLRQLVAGDSGSRLKEIIDSEDIELTSGPDVSDVGRIVPIINKVTAGYPVDFDDMNYPVGFADDYVRAPDINDPNAFAVRVVGDSMEPKFLQGDIVIFSPSRQINSGDDCFVRFTQPHETTFKRVFFEKDRKVRLQPRNDKYAPTIVRGDRINGIYRAVRRIELL